jgi:DNA-directed RNA polymerase subunit RPC12/RpoP
MGDIVDKIDGRLLYYDRSLERCRGYILSTSKQTKPLKCLRCGTVFAYPGEGTSIECPSCYGNQVFEASQQDVSNYAEKYCWSLYGKYISYLRTIRHIAEKICGKRLSCEFKETVDYLEIHIANYVKFIRLAIEASRGAIRAEATGVNYEMLDLINAISRASLEKKEILLEGGITYIYYLTTYDSTEVGHETLIREGFLDLNYYRKYLNAQGYEIYGSPGSIAKILDIKRGTIVTAVQ